MGIFDFITGNSKIETTATEIAKDISSGVDVMFYTDEEKAQAKREAMDQYLKWMETTMPMSRARRLIAMRISRIWQIFALAYLASIFITVFSPLENISSDTLLSKLNAFGIGYILPSFITVVVFYFGRHGIAEFNKSKKKEG